MQGRLKKRERINSIRSQLELEVSSFLPEWQDLNDFILPRRGRFFVTDNNQGRRRNQKIIDGTGTYAARILRSGMMSGVTSPARPWLRITTPDPKLAEFGRVKDWLHFTTTRMLGVFSRSNLYNTLPVVYGDMGTFATGCFSLEEDFEDTIITQPFSIGSYRIGVDHRGKVNIFSRTFRMSVRQIVNKFGQLDPNSNRIVWDNISETVKNFWEAGDTEIWIEVGHLIEPNPEWDPRSSLSKYKRFRSSYFEIGNSSKATGYFQGGDDEKFLREKGYDIFPILAPRWGIGAEDAYGTDCPGMDAIGDIKQLQHGERKGGQALDKIIDPPMTAPTSLQGKRASNLPGDITYQDMTAMGDSYRPAYQVNLDLQKLEYKQDQVRQRIKQAYYENLFLMLANTNRDMTATEVGERQEEKLLALGPVLEQLNQDCLDPLVDNTFEIMVRQGQIPEPPPELQGMDLKVEYTSIMAQAQKLVGISGIERFTGFVSNFSAIKPGILDKVDEDELADIYGDITSLPPGILRSDEDVAKMRQEQAQAQQQQVQMEQAQQGAGVMKDLAQIPEEGNTALRLLTEGRI